MKKRTLIIIGIVLVILVIAGLITSYIYSSKVRNNIGGKYRSEFMEYELEGTPNNTIKEKKVEDMSKIYIKVNNQVFNVELEDNLATKSLKEKLENGDIIVEAHEYGGFEKVGDLGFSLPKEDTTITTSAGDIVLYQGNQISLFYNSNSWSYTKLGRATNVNGDELKDILGSGDVTLILSLD